MEKNAHREERRQVEKVVIGERLWIGWIESFVGQFRSLVKMEQRKCENAVDMQQITEDTKQIADDTKQNKRRQSSWDPNSVGLGLGYFERAKLSHSCN
ncbi:hypothetical protein T01_3312 [Trichinella spiralis]|uniref:Uncharacterized protein n=1 Tax=Trichinella spiralis TaxID=6334 RepID=A0A0V1BS83_TRISP|nr:hypothetical protein T01_3312 [Trichinella spiralis]